VPVRDGTGDVIGFIGRYDGTRGDVPKYLNCAKTITYDKSVNLYRPSQHVLDPDAQVIVCEGTLDALAIAAVAASAGVSAKFAPVVESGLAISEAQWDTILAVHPGSIVLCADGDDAGRRANAQWAAELARRGRDSVITFWPDGDDPASYLAKHGPAGLASVTRAKANRALDDPRRWQNTYPVPAVLTRARFVADLAKKNRASGRSSGSTITRAAQPAAIPNIPAYNCGYSTSHHS
uniref:toprim domain-containing protein n=1 Tax=Ferrimicrobium sp. TaxID=2926050 RepID=UPI00261CFCF2